MKDNDKNDSTSPTAGGGGSFAYETESQIPEGAKTQKCSTSDSESGWFRMSIMIVMSVLGTRF